MENNAGQRFGHDVFISYSSKDKNVADAIVADFEQHGIKCWYAPRDIGLGKTWMGAIGEAIKKSKIVILVYSGESNQSKQVTNEMTLAFNEGKTIIPFRLSADDMNNDLEYFLTGVHWLDAITPPLSKNIEKLRIKISPLVLDEETISQIKTDEETPSQHGETGGQKSRGGGEIPPQDNGGGKGKKPTAILPLGIVIGVLLAVIVFLLVRNPRIPSPDPNSGTPQETAAAVEEKPAETQQEAAETDGVKPGESQNEKESSEAPLKPEAEEEITSDTVMDQGEGTIIRNIKDLEKIAEAGDANAQLEVGTAYYNGNGVEQDHKKAAEWYTKAAEQGYAKAQYKLGNCYYTGEGVDQDNVKAAEWYAKAAEQDYKYAQYWLGRLYESGNGVDQNLDTAIELYTKAAEQGYDKAQYTLGSCYYTGQCVDMDYAKAVEWYTKAAEQDYMYAQYWLGRMYESGLGMNQKNIDTAIEWYTKAAEQGYEPAKKKLEELK